MATRQKSSSSSTRRTPARAGARSSKSRPAGSTPRPAARASGRDATAARGSSKTNPESRGTRTSGRRTSSASGAAKFTTNHNEIRRFVESKNGRPACVRGTGGKGDVGLLRIDFPGYTGAQKLQPISWDDFFDKFDERNLGMLYQSQTRSGRPSNFVKLVDRDDAKARSGKGRR